MRPDEMYLRDILDAADSIIQSTMGVTFEQFEAQRSVRGAPLYEFIVIGEAAAKLSSDVRTRYPEIPWSDIIAFRNVVAHGYFALQWERVWSTITQRVPTLRAQIAAILAAEYPEEQP